MPTIYVKYNAGQSKPIKFQDRNGNSIGPQYAGIGAPATFTFVKAPGSDDFYFQAFYASPDPITVCPPTGPSVSEFQMQPLSPPNAATQMVVNDANSDQSATTYYYAVQISTTSTPPQSLWSDPQIVNHADPGSTDTAVRTPDDMPAVSPTFGRTASAADVSAPPPA